MNKQKLSYTELRELSANFDQKSKYHDLFLLEHIDKAVARAIELNYDAEIIEALKWHDFGKLFCFTEEEGTRHFIGHGALSAGLYEGNNEMTRNLIKFHNDKVTRKMITTRGINFCKKLLQMQECDNYAHSVYARENINNINKHSHSIYVLNSYLRERKIQQRLKSDFEYLESLGYEVVGIFLQGSQNYNLDTEQSDIDTKAIVLPRFDDFIKNKKAISTTLILESDEHIDVKDIRIMFDVLQKSNINFLEILFTKYKLLNKKYSKLLAPIFINAESIATWNMKALYNSIAGMSQQKYIALKHPYPSLIDKIEKFGYDPKQLHHILRQYEFIRRLAEGEPFKKCLVAKDADYFKKVKYGLHTLQEAEELAKDYNQKTFELKNKLLIGNDFDINSEVVSIYNTVKTDILRQWFKEELIGD